MKLTVQIIVWALIVNCAEGQPWDPVVLWDQVGAGEQSHFGARVFPLDDQNLDDYQDFAVLSGGTGPAGQPSEARFDLFHGGTPPSMTPYLTFRESLIPLRTEMTAETIGDVNGDGFIDWWIRYYQPDSANVAIWFFFGGPEADTLADAAVSLPVPGGGNLWRFCDYNGDGFDDFVRVNNNGDYVEVYFGGNPLDLVPDLTLHSDPPGSQSVWPISCGDVNGDGFDDFIASTNDFPGTVTRIYLGSAAPDTVADYVWTDFDAYPANLQMDLNGDGRKDIVISRANRMDVHLGRDTLSPIPDYGLSFANCGNPVQFMNDAGDFNGDGVHDLAAVNIDCNLGWGRVCLYLGYHWLNPDPVWCMDGRTLPLNLIGILWPIGLGDVNGDGTDDLAIGATNSDTDGKRGRVVVLSGDTTFHVVAEDVPVLPDNFHVEIYPNPFNSSTTIELSLTPTSSPLELVLYNTLGQVAYHVTLYPTTSTFRHSLSAEGLASGVYILAAQAGDLQKRVKMMVLK